MDVRLQEAKQRRAERTAVVQCVDPGKGSLQEHEFVGFMRKVKEREAHDLGSTRENGAHENGARSGKCKKQQKSVFFLWL